MNVYKVLSVRPGDDGYLKILTRGARKIPVKIPVSCKSHLVPGMRVCTFHNHAGHAVACSFGALVVINRPLRDVDDIREFIEDFRGLYSLKLDSLAFKYQLGRSLRKMGFHRTGSSVVNMMVYNYVNDLGRTGR